MLARDYILSNPKLFIVLNSVSSQECQQSELNKNTVSHCLMRLSNLKKIKIKIKKN